MDILQMAGHLSLEFDAVVTGPFHKGAAQEMVHVIRPDGYGVALMFGPGKGQAPESQAGKLDVWHVREIPGSHLIDMTNSYDMVKFATDLDGAREVLREVGPHTWAALDARPGGKYGTGK